MRKEIRELLNKPYYSSGNYTDYDRLKESLTITFHYEGSERHLTCREVDEFSDCGIDHWFKGIIQSLYYKPNHYGLALVGKHEIGKTQFFRRLAPQKDWYGKDTYNSMIIDLEDAIVKKDLDYVEMDNFTVINPYTPEAYAEKRLVSYCCSTNIWNYPPRKNWIVLNVESISFELYNSIDKEQLWIEIFNKFKS